MRIDAALLAILACPACRAPLRLDEEADEHGGTGTELVCTRCGLAYPVRDDIPILLVDQARRPKSDSSGEPDGR